MAIRCILVPCDFSACSAAALQMAVELARPFSANVHLLHSYWVNLSLAAPEPLVLPVDLLDRLREGARIELEQLEKSVAQAGVPCSIHLSPAPPVAAILEGARELSADLIVMGTEGLTGMKHVLLGSVAERVVRLAPCPVLTVKAR